MKKLLKGELFVIFKQKSKLIVILLLMLTYFSGMVFANESHKDFINDIKKSHLDISLRMSSQKKDDDCVLGLYDNLKSKRGCGIEFYSDEEIKFAKARKSFNDPFSTSLHYMRMALEFNDAENYYLSRLEMLITAKKAQDAGFENAYYLSNGLYTQEDDAVVTNEISSIKQMLDNNYQLQMSPYEINGSNYLRVFLANGGILAIIMITLLFNMDIFIDENSRSVNNVLYSQAYSRSKIIVSKLIVSSLYCILVISVALSLSYFITGVVFNFGSFDFPIINRSNINSFTQENVNLFVISSVKNQLIYSFINLVLLLLAALFIMHLFTFVFSNSSTGLFFVYLLLSMRFVLDSILGKLLKFYPFAYDNMQAIFNNDYNYLYGILSLSGLVISLFIIILFIGKRIDIKVGD